MTDQNRVTTFEDRLLSSLKRVVSERSALNPPHSVPSSGGLATSSVWKSRVALAAAAVTVALIGTVVVPFGVGDSPAYAVTSAGGEKVRIEINHLSDADGLERKIEEVGVSAEVDYLPSGQYCAEPRFTPAEGNQGGLAGSEVTEGFEGNSDGSLAFTIDPAEFESDETLVIVTSGPKEGPVTTGTEIMTAAAVGPVAPCEPVDGPSHNPPHP